MQNLNHDYPLFQEVPSANVVLRKFMVYLDLDDNFIIHMIEIKQPTGSGRRCRKLLMKMGDNIVSKKSVIKYHYSQHLPCFGVAVYLAKIYAESKSRLPSVLRRPIGKNGVKQIYDLFDKASGKYGAVAACHWEQFGVESCFMGCLEWL